MRLWTLSFAVLAVFTTCQVSAAAECTKHKHDPEDLDEYYESADGLTGGALKTALNQIIRGHTRYTYTPCVWAMLKEADEDPDNSDNVIAFYSRRSVPKADRDQGQNDPDSWNREHIWAKSHGFPNKSQHAYTDAHHLRAADRSVNTDRSDHDFDSGGDPDTECTGCREGDDTWEPPDSLKGDVARMMFYMPTRYEGSDASNTPDLELVDSNDTARGETGRFGKLCTLLQWHLDDPVTVEERTRNDVIHSWQGNRNPFIDHPEYVMSIWGADCDDVEEPADADRAALLERIKAIEREVSQLRALIEGSSP